MFAQSATSFACTARNIIGRQPSSFARRATSFAKRYCRVAIKLPFAKLADEADSLLVGSALAVFIGDGGIKGQGGGIAELLFYL